jgi:FtsH-binding integral membrane protein
MYKPEYGTSSLTSNARSNFVTKVFSIVGVQLLVTTAFIGINMNYPKFARFQLESTLLFWVSIIGTIGSMLVLSKFFNYEAYSQSQSKTFPNNMAWLGLFTLCQSHLVSITTSLYTPETVFLCALATVAATLGLALFAMTTKSDFTSIGNSVTGKTIN